MPKCSDPAADAHWRHLLRGFPASGLSVGEFCARHGVSRASFYSHRRRSAAGEVVPPAPAPRPCGGPLFVPLRVRDEGAPAPGVVAEPAAPPPAEGRIELLLGGGLTVRLFGEVPAARLASVLGVLGGKAGRPC